MESKVSLRVVHFLLVRVLFPIAFLLLTPLRILFDFLTLKHPDLFRRTNTPLNHDRKVKEVQEQVLAWNRKGRRGRLCTGRPSWHSVHIRTLDKGGMTKINLDLEDIVQIDVEERVRRREVASREESLLE